MPPFRHRFPISLDLLGKVPFSLLFLATIPSLTCASSPQTQADLIREMLEAIAEAHQRDGTYLVRRNPVPCDCPEWEVQLDGTWYRAFLEPLEGPVESLRDALTDPEGKALVRTARVQGRLSTSVRVSGNRTQCLVLKVFSPCLEGECEAGP